MAEHALVVAMLLLKCSNQPGVVESAEHIFRILRLYPRQS